MALLQLQNLTYASLKTDCYIKWVWSADWVYFPYLEAITAANCANPGLGVATFKLLYGQGFWEDYLSMGNGNILTSFKYAYIQIRGRAGRYQTILWTGIVPAEEFKLLGRSGAYYTADQTIKAFSLDWLLESRLDGSVAEQSGETPVNIDWLPAFNKRAEYGGTIIGNKSALKTEYGCSIFSDADNVWSNYDILLYLLHFYQWNNGPQFVLGGPTDVLNFLDSIEQVWDFNQLTLRGALNELISTNRGLGWTPRIDFYGNCYIQVFSLLDRSLKVGDFTVPANNNKIWLNLWDDKRTTIDINQDISQTFDEIIVEGEAMKVAVSVDFADSILEEGWTFAEELKYKIGASTTDGYSGLEDEEKRKLNDEYRSAERFSRVYTTFRIKKDWNWKLSAGTVVAVPKLNNMAEFIVSGGAYTQAAYWNVDKRIQADLPLLAGLDYSTDPPGDNNPVDSEPEFRKIMVLVKDKDGKYQLAENVTVIDEDDELAEFGASIRPLAREFAIEVKFRPAYMFARNHFDTDIYPPGLATDSIDDVGFDFEDMIATVFLETDQVLWCGVNFNNYENKRYKIIDIPDCELWYMPAGTVHDIDEDGERILTLSETILRDDRDKLRAALAAAVAWYGRLRNRLTMTIKSVDAGIPVGTFVENLDVTRAGAAGAAVTNISWNFAGKDASTIVTTDLAELNISSFFKK